MTATACRRRPWAQSTWSWASCCAALATSASSADLLLLLCVCVAQTADINTTAPQEVMVETLPISDDICMCDLTASSCDVNCCCDQECSGRDRLAFSSCEVRPQPVLDAHHCYQTHFVFHNNTEVQLVRSLGGLFCIMRDNLPARWKHSARRTVRTLQELNTLRRTHRTFSWPTHSSSCPVFNSASPPFKAGTVMWVGVNGTLAPFKLPHRVLGGFCRASHVVRYLLNWSGSCAQVGITGAADCTSRPDLQATTFHKYMNETELVEAFLCTGQDNCSSVAALPAPHFNKTCRNVLKRARYDVYHNGTSGVTRVCVYLWLADLPVRTELTQEFAVSFLWAGVGDKPFHRSGNPGYLIGRPVWGLSLRGAMADGTCGIRLPVLFGEDVRSSCSETNWTCGAVLAGSIPSHVATSGDAKGDWVQVVVAAPLPPALQEDGVCRGVVASLHLDVMFAHVGSHAAPQAKVLGVLLRFGFPRDLPLDQRLDLVSSVAFLDVTRPATARFAEPPVYEVRLPHDFFYPFLSSRAAVRPDLGVLVTLALSGLI